MPNANENKYDVMLYNKRKLVIVRVEYVVTKI